ncbi:putative kinetochore protein SPC24, partial [Tolypocladium ophioglossoides CBS 100239]
HRSLACRPSELNLRIQRPATRSPPGTPRLPGLEQKHPLHNTASMLLAEDPATLIHHTINNFNITPDKLAVARVHESLSTLQQARDLRVRDAEASLRRLARQLGTLAAQHDELRAAHSPGEHASRIATLDTRKFRTAKAASDAEAEAERLAGRAADLAARLQELDLQGVEGDAAARRRDPVDDEVLLRLKVYRSLGIDIERDERDGEWSRAVVRNDRKGDVHVVNMDKKFSRFFYANYFWQTL